MTPCIKKDYFSTFCRISKALTSTLDKDELLNLILQSAIDAMDGKAASLFLKADDQDLFVPVCQKGLSGNYLHADPYKAKSLIDDILKGGGYLEISDVTKDARVENVEAKKNEGIASLLVVPVMVEDRAIGVLSLYAATPRNFSEEEVEFLRALADQGGIGIQNARLVERLTQNAVLFRNLVQNINSTNLDIKEILGVMTEDIAENFGMKGVSIRLLNRDTETLEDVASYGLSEEFISKGPISTDKSISQAMDGEIVVIKDAVTDDRIQYRDAMKKEGVASILSVPVRFGDEVIGVMRLYSETQREFPEDMVILVEGLAQQGGIAIANASLYLSLQEDKKSLEEEIWSHRLWF